MTKNQRALIKRLTTILHFLDLHAEALFPLNLGTVRAELDVLVDALERVAISQVAATERSRAHAALQRDLRANLRTVHLRPIIAVGGARIGRTRAAARLKLPRCHAPDRVLVETAMHVAAILGKRKSALLAECFEADYLDRLLVAAELLAAAGREADRCRLESTSATRELVDLATRGRELARCLNALVTAKARRNRSLLADWRRATAVRRPESVPHRAPAAAASPDLRPPGALTSAGEQAIVPAA
jgi:hypothetical protein